MNLQHEWCKEKGYRFVRTKTKNQFRSMLVLNIKHGFDVIGTHINQKKEVMIVVEKIL